MIGSLKGSVDSLGIDNCIIETAGGVGYRVFMPAAQLAQRALRASRSVQRILERVLLCACTFTPRCVRMPLFFTAF